MANDDKLHGQSVPVTGTGWVPVPDPTALTDAAISRAGAQFQRELDAIRELLAERIQTEADLRDRAVTALRDVTTRRMDDLDQQIFRRFALTDALPAQMQESRQAELQALRELIETRLTAMDTATELVAADMKRVPNVLTERVNGLRELIGERLDAMDKATALLAHDVGTVPTDIDKAITALRELLGERIDGMDVATKLLASNVTNIAADIDKSANGLKAVIDTRLAGMDEATKLLATNVDKVPYAILQEAGNLKALIMSKIEDVSHVSDEKFKAVESTFASNALALAAALAAQEKAVAEQNKSNTLAITKSEVTTKETIAANAQQTQTAQRSLEATLADLKERVVRIESTGAGVNSVTGSPYESAILQQTRDAADRTAKQAEAQALAAQEAARTAQSRAVMALVISGILVCITLVSVIFAIIKK